MVCFLLFDSHQAAKKYIKNWVEQQNAELNTNRYFNIKDWYWHSELLHVNFYTLNTWLATLMEIQGKPLWNNADRREPLLSCVFSSGRAQDKLLRHCDAS